MPPRGAQQKTRPVGRVSDEGQVVTPAREVVRFRTRISLMFPPSEIHDLRRGAEAEDEGPGAPPQMEVAFMGLTGPLGVLPPAYTELLIERLRAKDRTLSEFLDLFNHRLISFFYRAWEKYRFPVAYERGAGRSGDQFTSGLFALIGMGTRGLRGRLGIGDESLLAYGGLIAQQPHSAISLAAVIGDYFGVPARVEQFFGQWLKLDDESRSRLGRDNSQLGFSTVIGSRVWDTQSKFRLKLGPLTYQEFFAFLPVGSAFRPVQELTRLLAGLEFDFDLQLKLKAAEVPGTELTTQAARQPMLGWNSWLKTRPFAADDEQVVLAVNH